MRAPADDVASAPEHAEAIELIATWVALAGIADAAALSEVRADDYRYEERLAEAPPGARPSSTDDAAEAVRICDSTALRVLDEGYDARFFAQTVQPGDRLTYGRRELSLRGGPGALRVRRDLFVVEGERLLSPSRPRPFAGADCGGASARGDVVLLAPGQAPRRLRYPEPASR